VKAQAKRNVETITSSVGPTRAGEVPTRTTNVKTHSWRNVAKHK